MSHKATPQTDTVTPEESCDGSEDIDLLDGPINLDLFPDYYRETKYCCYYYDLNCFSKIGNRCSNDSTSVGGASCIPCNVWICSSHPHVSHCCFCGAKLKEHL